MSMPINPEFPIGPVRTVEELMDLATGMENDAAARYEELVIAMQRRDEPALADLFRRLAALEREHEEGIARWAVRDGLRPPAPAHYPWRLPETFDNEADGAAAHTLSPYEALAIAVRNEERAFTFYTYVYAVAGSAEIQRRAKALAQEELSHVALLRDWRRRAYHAARPAASRGLPGSPEELRVRALGLERVAAEVERRRRACSRPRASWRARDCCAMRRQRRGDASARSAPRRTRPRPAARQRRARAPPVCCGPVA
ncbi:ferritin-like domain-containing protein [Azospirillum canadense]|uniref:ferritin-like domain-containing protein n=1 Tax=Azospirillum canadense TaxID=403962 RepID=UPI00222781A8|nr:ferritin family protein [Azospirillum canadense]MCW2242485.1 rubrerythrin [Azospirillum canadense]